MMISEGMKDERSNVSYRLLVCVPQFMLLSSSVHIYLSLRSSSKTCLARKFCFVFVFTENWSKEVVQAVTGISMGVGGPPFHVELLDFMVCSFFGYHHLPAPLRFRSYDITSTTDVAPGFGVNQRNERDGYVHAQHGYRC